MAVARPRFGANGNKYPTGNYSTEFPPGVPEDWTGKRGVQRDLTRRGKANGSSRAPHKQSGSVGDCRAK